MFKYMLHFSLVTMISLFAGAKEKAFRSIYYDKASKTTWSAKLENHYTNGCVVDEFHFDKSRCTYQHDSDGSLKVKIEDSEAAKACNKIGGTLPTKADFENLIRSFDHTFYAGGPILTKQGVSEFKAAFDFDPNRFDSDVFWSSTVYDDNTTWAWMFGITTSSGYLIYHPRSYSRVYVSCIRK